MGYSTWVALQRGLHGRLTERVAREMCAPFVARRPNVRIRRLFVSPARAAQASVPIGAMSRYEPLPALEATNFVGSNLGLTTTEGRNIMNKKVLIAVGPATLPTEGRRCGLVPGAAT